MALLEGQVKPNPLDILRDMTSIYSRAAAEGMNVSHYLEREIDPSGEWTGEERAMGAFGRVMDASGIIFRSNPAMGYQADTFGRIMDDPVNRALVPEMASTVWRQARSLTGYQPQVHGRMVFTSDEILNTAMRPYVDATSAYETVLRPTLSLAEIVGMTNAIQGDAYRQVYLEDPTPNDVRWFRIPESTDIPRGQMRTSQKAVRMLKYGRALELSYEVLRNQPIDRVAFWIARSAIQVETDRVAQAIDVVINGDGNTGTAAEVFESSDLDPAATSALTPTAWLNFKAKFRDPYTMTHVFAREAEGTALQLLRWPTNSEFITAGTNPAGIGAVEAVQPIYGGTVRLGNTDQIPVVTYVAIDRRFALERLTEIGSDIQETVQFIERQTRLLTFTENEGYSRLDRKAAKILVIA